MIQRIQSIFLLLAAACAFCLFAFPFATTDTNIEASSLFSDGIYNLNDHQALLALFAVAGGLSAIAIFLFKNRKTQLMLGRFAIIANIIGIVLLIVFFFQDRDTYSDLPNDGFGIYLPVLFLVFAGLALRNISKDEKLVRSSYDRLR